MKYVCIGLLKLYKATLSRLKGRKVCIYTPSCSVYSMEAYAEHGFLWAVGLRLNGLCDVRRGAKAVSTPSPSIFAASGSGTCSFCRAFVPFMEKI